MVVVKTKLSKHVSDNEKRRLALKEKANVKSRQSEAIKEALSSSNLHNSSNKKKFFNENSDEDENKNENGNSKPSLFDAGLSSDDEHIEIKEKSQFEGKKGFELLNLQSTYGNDERFKISEKFLENEDDEENVETSLKTNDSEKSKELKILESVLNQQVSATNEKKTNKRTYEMLRYDATNKDHVKYEITPSKEFSSTPKKRKKGSKLEKLSREQEPSIEVSKEKFYQVSSEIKNSFKNKTEESSFSLLQAYGQNLDKTESPLSDEEYDVKEKETKNFNETNSFPQKTQKEENVSIKNDTQIREESKTKGSVARGIWKESFFFLPNDPRFKEGLEFINKMDSEEAKNAAENYDGTRRKLKEILRLHMKKVLSKKDPFKNKIGGMSKKKLINSKYKNKKTFHPKQKNRRGINLFLN